MPAAMSSTVSIGPAHESPIGTTLERHLLDRQRRMPQATGDFTGLFQQISLAAKIIGSRVSKAGLSGILGRTGATNVQGEQVQKLDDFANTIIVNTVEAGGHVCVMGSEEVDNPIQIPSEYPQGKYVLQFDPSTGQATSTSTRRSEPFFRFTGGSRRMGRPGRCGTCCSRAATSWLQAT